MVHEDNDHHEDDSERDGAGGQRPGAAAGQGGSGRVEWLVLLQVPGLKELQTILHRQAFFQTTTGDLAAGVSVIP